MPRASNPAHRYLILYIWLVLLSAGTSCTFLYWWVGWVETPQGCTLVEPQSEEEAPRVSSQGDHSHRRVNPRDEYGYEGTRQRPCTAIRTLVGGIDVISCLRASSNLPKIITGKWLLLHLLRINIDRRTFQEIVNRLSSEKTQKEAQLQRTLTNISDDFATTPELVLEEHNKEVTLLVVKKIKSKIHHSRKGKTYSSSRETLL